jgi:hypothetical protein
VGSAWDWVDNGSLKRDEIQWRANAKPPFGLARGRSFFRQFEQDAKPFSSHKSLLPLNPSLPSPSHSSVYKNAVASPTLAHHEFLSHSTANMTVPNGNGKVLS